MDVYHLKKKLLKDINVTKLVMLIKNFLRAETWRLKPWMTVKRQAGLSTWTTAGNTWCYLPSSINRNRNLCSIRSGLDVPHELENTCFIHPRSFLRFLGSSIEPREYLFKKGPTQQTYSVPAVQQPTRQQHHEAIGESVKTNNCFTYNLITSLQRVCILNNVQ